MGKKKFLTKKKSLLSIFLWSLCFSITLSGCSDGGGGGGKKKEKAPVVETVDEYDGTYLVVFDTEVLPNDKFANGELTAKNAFFKREIVLLDGKGSFNIEGEMEGKPAKLTGEFAIDADGVLDFPLKATLESRGLSVDVKVKAKIENSQVTGTYEFFTGETLLGKGTLSGGQIKGASREGVAEPILTDYDGSYRIKFVFDKTDAKKTSAVEASAAQEKHACVIIKDGVFYQAIEKKLADQLSQFLDTKKIVYQNDIPTAPFDGMLHSDGSFLILSESNTPLELVGGFAANKTMAGTFRSTNRNGVFSGTPDPKCTAEDAVYNINNPRPIDPDDPLGLGKTGPAVLCYSFTSFYHMEGGFMTAINTMISIISLSSSSVYCRPISGTAEDCAGNTIFLLGDMVMSKYASVQKCLEACKDYPLFNLDVGGCSGVIGN